MRARNRLGRTAMHVAAASDSVASLELLRREAPPATAEAVDLFGRSLLATAALYKRQRTVDGPSAGRAPLRVAFLMFAWRDARQLKLLLDAGAKVGTLDVDGAPLIVLAASLMPRTQVVVVDDADDADVE